MARRLFCRVGSRRIFLTSSEGGLANFLSLTYTQKRRKKEASLSKREFICFAGNIFHRKIFSIVFDGKYFPLFLMENIFHHFSVGNSLGVNY